ncbi:adenylylsulfatase HINT3 isoform X2 [Medicago truncatula]|uniref:adenylylsulfatase HINT3 isoform X2 n=1 Tax=Medicago truncatula TaxID=3880 RepID=UPI000D2F17B2|nr:adenylylsulfatase HINT3 isoform X2 [Medicago truncatula]
MVSDFKPTRTRRKTCPLKKLRGEELPFCPPISTRPVSLIRIHSPLRFVQPVRIPMIIIRIVSFATLFAVNHLLSRHSLIIPKSHYPSLDATPPSVVAAMSSKVPFISNAIMKATGCNSFNVLINNGAAAGQVIFHTHMHIIPRKAYDCLWASESLLRRPLNLDDEKVSQLAASIQEQLLVSDICQESKNEEDFCPSKS